MNQTPENNDNSERRNKARITCNCAAIVYGHDEDGQEFEETARVLNMSAGGIYLLLSHSIDTGDKISVQIALPIGSPVLKNPKLVTKGIVLRREPHSMGMNGIAVKFNHHRFL